MGGKKEMVEKIVTIIFCHLVGDYVLQNDFLAKTKSHNFYHLLVHCALYCIPFAVIYGIDWRIAILFVMHLVVDFHKCIKVFNYTIDQTFHYLIAFALYLGG